MNCSPFENRYIRSVARALFFATALIQAGCGGSSAGDERANPDLLPPNTAAALIQSGVDIEAPLQTAAVNPNDLVVGDMNPRSGNLGWEGEITLYFTEIIDPASVTPENIQIFNETKAQFIDVDFEFDAHEITLIPATKPVPGDLHILLVHEGIRSTNNMVLKQSLWADFSRLQPEPLELARITNQPVSTLRDPDDDLLFQFNNHIDRETMAGNVTFRSVTTNTPVDFEFRKDPLQTGFFINPVFRLKAGHTYEATLKLDLRDVDGQSLGYEFVKQFVVSNGPFHATVDLRIPAEGEQGFDPASQISIRYSDLLDPATVAQDFNYLRTAGNLYPSTTVYAEGDTLYIIPDEPLEYDETYFIALPFLHHQSLFGANGLKVGHGWTTTWAFTTIADPGL